MQRIVVVGQPAPAGALCFREFARMLALRLGAHQVTEESPTTVMQEEAWVGAEPAGVFTEKLFREADTIVWLHFSPLPFVRDWASRVVDVLRRAAAAVRRRQALARASALRASWSDIRRSFSYLQIAPEMYALMGHPALSHARVIELRSPQQAEFWLMTQRRRSGLGARSGAGAPAH
ncbi:MAG: hypothetical protein ACM3PU_06365 [Gemmatimonadota bacterium]